LGTDPVHRILILGGTSEALELARRLCARPGIVVTTSLAGRTRRPRLPPGRVRIGGFGGPAGLARYLREQRIDVVVDATHPFAARISANVVRAAADAGIPILAYQRTGGPLGPGAAEVPDLDHALRLGWTLGRRLLVTFRLDGALGPVPSDGALVVRAIEPPAHAPDENVRWLLDRGPYRPEQERQLLERLALDVVIAKASGGGGAKFEAAGSLGCHVVLITRPPATAASHVVHAVADAVHWLEAQTLGRST
jgi:precorrin-6A/cobalt-precorrin-6A reductase